MKKSICMIFAGLLTLSLNTIEVNAGHFDVIESITEKKGTEGVIREKEYNPLDGGEAEGSIFEYKYDSKGDIVEIIQMTYGEVVNKTLIMYDELGRLMTIKECSTFMSEDYTETVYQYGEDGSAVATERRMFDGELDYEVQYEIYYNEIGKMNSIVYISSSNRAERTILYDAAGNVSEILCTGGSPDDNTYFVMDEIMSYDAYGNMTERTITSVSNNNETTVANDYFANEYDSNGRLIKVTETSIYEGDVHYIECNEYFYE